jgi:hypothetical protein
VKTRIFALLAAMILSFAIIGSGMMITTTTTPVATTIAYAQTQEEEHDSHDHSSNSSIGGSANVPLVQFAANFEMIKGHLEKAIENKNRDNVELAKAHAGHPIAEHYTVLESQINQADAQINNELKQTLTTLVNKVNSTSAVQFRIEVENASALLDQAYSDVIPEADRNDIKFNASVVVALVTEANKEYVEGVKDGKIIAVVEYQDAQAFAERAEKVFFDHVANNLTAHEKDATADLFKQLATSMNEIAEPHTIDEHIKGIITEVAEGTGITISAAEMSMDSNETSPMQYIQNIRDLLDQVSTHYQQGNYTGAETLAISAYLNNFENIEGQLVNANRTQLMEDVEQLLRDELRQMIKDRVGQEVLDAHIAAINTKLDRVAEALS